MKLSTKGLIDKPDTLKIRVLDHMVTELSPHMTSDEIDKCVEFMITIKDSKFDVNPSIEDSKSQLKIILGTERFEEIVMKWNMSNQKLLTSFGKRKYKRISDGTIWDGLDPEDIESDYEKIYV
jgi:hypothetical protein